MVYEEVFKEFELNGVRYIVTGGVAVNLYGYIRLTMDLDIMVDLSEENLIRVANVMQKLGYTPKLPVKAQDIVSKENREKWIKEKGAVVFTFIDLKNPYKIIDIFLINPIEYDEAYSRKEVLNIGGTVINLISIDDIIKMKSRTGRQRDFEDINHLERIKILKRGGK